ncbi:MAG: hypothetical protein NC406_04775 [Bacteroides sp.]|nr:hypothetical protein [Bacteroides sp.]MCM1095836.1 hypothetical protein [Terasakiella sp.]
MSTSFYILMGILACLSIINLLNAKRRSQSKARTFALWFNGLALTLILLALTIAILQK